jgi:hypothetical protein
MQRPERCGLFRGGTRAGGQDRPNALHRVLHPPTLGFLRPYPLWPNRTRLASLIIVQTRALTPYITGVSHSDEVRSDGTDDAGVTSSVGGARRTRVTSRERTDTRHHPPGGRAVRTHTHLPPSYT